MRTPTASTNQKRAAGRGWRARERGSTLVEFGLSLMVLMTLMLGVVEFSRSLYAYHFVSHAARQAARWAAVNGSTCGDDGSCVGSDGMNNGYATAADIQNYAIGLAPTGINSQNVTAAVSWPKSGTAPPSNSLCSTYPTAPGCFCYTSTTIGNADTDANGPGCPVQVKVSYDFHFIFPFVHSGALQLSSTAQSVITH